MVSLNNFYPRPPRGGRPNHITGSIRCHLFLSTPSARRATSLPGSHVIHDSISIHALREEGDCQHCPWRADQRDFYPRPPRGGRPKASRSFSRVIYFYPRPPRGGRPDGHLRNVEVCTISIHALREEGDVRIDAPDGRVERFLSTPSARRATAALDVAHQPNDISIHALREEGDGRSCLLHGITRRDFYPRPPRGGRPIKRSASSSVILFLSTPSARRAT